MYERTAAVMLLGLLVGCAQPQPQPQPQLAASAAAPSPGAAAVPTPASTSAPPPNAVPAPTPASTPAATRSAEGRQEDRIVDIRGARCQDLLRLSPDDRAAAAMFYIGYQASRLRAKTVNVSLIPSIEAQAYIYCQQDPDRPVAQAFADAYSRTGR